MFRSGFGYEDIAGYSLKSQDAKSLGQLLRIMFSKFSGVSGIQFPFRERCDVSALP
jgi:hypothetical protein